MKVHKRPKKLIYDFPGTMCGANFHPLFDEHSTTSKWKKVTCKSCLKKKGK